MAKINFLTAYPTATPAADSIVIGSLAANGATNNFLMSAIATYVMSAPVSTITLQQVCDIGAATTTGMTIADTLTLSKPTGDGLSVTANANVAGNITSNGTLTLTNLIGQRLVVQGQAKIENTLEVGNGIKGTGDLNLQTGGVNRLSIANAGNITVSSATEIADTLTLSKATGTGLSVTADASVGGNLTATSLQAGGVTMITGSSTSFGSGITSLFGMNSFSDFKLIGNEPSSATDTGSAGQIAVDADYIYVCTATDTWKRVAITTW